MIYCALAHEISSSYHLLLKVCEHSVTLNLASYFIVSVAHNISSFIFNSYFISTGSYSHSLALEGLMTTQ